MKTHIIIGASSGIGRRLAQNLADAGDKVYGTYNQTVVEDPGEIRFQQLNVLDDQLLLEDLPDTIDGLVYCPGDIKLKPFSRIKPEMFVDDYNLQVVGAVKVLQEVIPRLKMAENGASVVLFSTVAVQSGYNFHSLVSASKGAVEGLTRALAAEFAPSIRFNCIAPSLTDTPLSSRLLNTDAKREVNKCQPPPDASFW